MLFFLIDVGWLSFVARWTEGGGVKARVARKEGGLGRMEDCKGGKGDK